MDKKRGFFKGIYNKLGKWLIGDMFGDELWDPDLCIWPDKYDCKNCDDESCKQVIPDKSKGVDSGA